MSSARRTQPTAAASARPKRRFDELSASEQESLLASGRKRVHNSTLRVSGLRTLRASNCTICGDGNHVIGNFNILIGKRNTADGDGNRFVVPVDPPPRSVPAPPPQRAVPAPLPQNARSERPASRRRVGQVADSPSPGQVLIAQLDAIMASMIDRSIPAAPVPVARAVPATDVEVASALDLPGEAVRGDSEEMSCIVCLEKQKDTLFKPCRHICCCRDCARQLTQVHLEQKKNTAFSCPKCRQPVTALTIVYI